MIRFKKIISILLVIATIFFVMVVPASATTGDALAWVKSKFHTWVYNQYGAATDGSDNFWYQLFQPDDGECDHVWTYNVDGEKYCSVCGMTWDDYLASKYDTSYEDVGGGGRSAYSDTVANINSIFGTYTLVDDAGVRGWRVSLNNTSYFDRYSLSTVHVIGTNWHYEWASYTADGIYLYFDSVISPVSGNYVVSFVLSSNVNASTEIGVASGSVSSGASVTPYMYSESIVSNSANSYSAIVGSAYVTFYPDGDLSGSSSVDVSPASRVGSITAPLGYYDADNNLQVNTSNTPIVDEANNTYYNPVTNNTTNITNWTYDYSDRSYTVTTEAGDTYTITYGDTNITINEGDTVYNVYYVVGDDSGSTDDDSTGWDWWKTEWTDFRSWLSGLSFVGGGDSSELTDSPDSSGSSSSSSSGDTSAFYSIDDATGDITINQDYDYSGEEDGLDFGGVVKATGKGIWWLAKSVIGIFAGAITNVGSAVSGLAKIGNASNTTGAYGFFFQ